MGFSQAAKGLLAQAKTISPEVQAATGKLAIIRDLEKAGWSREELLTAYRDLYENTDEDSIKRQVLDSISKIHGLQQIEDTMRVVPVIQLNISGDNVRIANMLCPGGA